MRIGPRHGHFAAFHWLAEGFQHVSGKLREFIHEKHAVMRKADLAGFGPSPPTNDRGHGGGVMRLTKGAGAADAAFGQDARQRMNHRRFKGFQRAEWRQYAGQPCGQHGFTRAGAAHHQQMMPPRRGDFQGAFGPFLPFDIPQIPLRGIRRDVFSLGGGQWRLPGEVANDLIKPGCGQNLRRADPSCLCPAGFRA